MHLLLQRDQRRAATGATEHILYVTLICSASEERIIVEWYETTMHDYREPLFAVPPVPVEPGQQLPTVSELTDGSILEVTGAARRVVSTIQPSHSPDQMFTPCLIQPSQAIDGVVITFSNFPALIQCEREIQCAFHGVNKFVAGAADHVVRDIKDNNA